MFTVSGNLCGRLAEVMANRLYLCSFYDHPESNDQIWYYCVDEDVHYDNYYTDFGPLNLSVLYRFCKKLDEKLKVAVSLILFLGLALRSLEAFFFLFL